MQSQNFMVGDPLSLERIRSVLIRLEETIIFGLIERAQFAHNPRMYQRGAFKELAQTGFEGSWLEWFLKEIETFHGKLTRFLLFGNNESFSSFQQRQDDTRGTSLPQPLRISSVSHVSSPDEYPFTSNLPEPVLAPLKFPEILFPNKINANASILSFYIRYIVPRITRRATLALAASKRSKGIVGDEEFEDDGNYGSAATIDVEVLQSISKRVHYGTFLCSVKIHMDDVPLYPGKFVSESKFLEDPAAFIPHIRNPNPKALEDLITKPEVERKLLQRLQKKAATYAQDFAPDGSPNGINGNSGKIDVDGVVELYESYIIRLTKEVEASVEFVF